MELELKMVEKLKKLCLDFENEYRKIENEAIFINFDDFADRTVALIDELSIRGIEKAGFGYRGEVHEDRLKHYHIKLHN